MAYNPFRDDDELFDESMLAPYSDSDISVDDSVEPMPTFSSPENNPEQFDKEMNQDIDLAMNELDQGMSLPQPQTIPQPEVPEEDDSLSLLQRLAIAKSGAQIGQSIAGGVSGNFDAKTPALDMLEKFALAKQKAKDKKELGGSRRYQQMVTFDPVKKQNVIKLFDTSTGETKDLDEVKGFATQFRADPITKELMALSPGTSTSLGNVTGDKRAEQRKELEKLIEKKKEVDSRQVYQSLTPTDRGYVNDTRAEYLTETKDQRESLNKLKGLSELQVDEATTNQIAASQLGAQVATIFENGRLTDEDVLRYTRRQGIVSNLKDYTKLLSSGTIPKDKADEIKQSLRTYQKALKMALRDKALEKSKSLTNKLETDYRKSPQVLGELVYSDFNEQEIAKVRVRTPQGKVGTIPADQLENALKAGYEEVK